MKLYMHPVSMTSRPVRLFAADNNIAMDEEVVDLMTGAHMQPPYSEINPNCLVPMLDRRRPQADRELGHSEISRRQDRLAGLSEGP